jgi:hypothetical protein
MESGQELMELLEFFFWMHVAIMGALITSYWYGR